MYVMYYCMLQRVDGRNSYQRNVVMHECNSGGAKAWPDWARAPAVLRQVSSDELDYFYQ